MFAETVQLQTVKMGMLVHVQFLLAWYVKHTNFKSFLFFFFFLFSFSSSFFFLLLRLAQRRFENYSETINFLQAV
jgi:hypothetical protein